MKYKIRGDALPILDMELQEGESVFTESGGMAWMSPNIKMDTNMKGGIGKSLGRMFTGESLFLVNYTCEKDTGLISFCNEFPGKIVPFTLKEGQSVTCQRDAFMVAEESIQLKTVFTKRLGAGFFGGEGFFLQQISGPGNAFLEFSGEITEYTLEEGQTLKVDPGYIGAFEPTIDYNIVRIKGIKNMLFGGEGIFVATLTGPGKVWLQSMPLSNLVKKIVPYVSKK
ncbi:TIGR00266 family protein [Candidatus Dojkabacteria bacterium]|nr:TIGR00266 family protein [Candidatus Dojkabacteria bacterium]